MTERLPPVDRDLLDGHGKSFYDRLVADFARVPYRIADDKGRLIGIFRVDAYAPELAEGISELARRWRCSKRLTRRMREIAILVTSAAGLAGYIWYAHARTAADVLNPDELDRLRRRAPAELSDATDQLVHDIARAINDDGDLDDVLYRRAVDGIGYDGLTELIWLIGVYRTEAMQLRVHRLGVPTGVKPPFPG